MLDRKWPLSARQNLRRGCPYRSTRRDRCSSRSTGRLRIEAGEKSAEASWAFGDRPRLWYTIEKVPRIRTTDNIVNRPHKSREAPLPGTPAHDSSGGIRKSPVWTGHSFASPMKRILWLGAIGGIGFVVDAGILQALFVRGIQPIIARCISFPVAVTATWLLNKIIAQFLRVRRNGFPKNSPNCASKSCQNAANNIFDSVVGFAYSADVSPTRVTSSSCIVIAKFRSSAAHARDSRTR
jgi:putative flippase GtrA